MCTKIFASVPENPELQSKANMPEIPATVPGLVCLKSRLLYLDINISYYEQMPETRTVYLESVPRSLKSRENLYRNHGQCA